MGYTTRIDMATLAVIVAFVGAPMVLCMLRVLARDLAYRTQAHDLQVGVNTIRIALLRRRQEVGIDEADLLDVEVIDEPTAKAA